MAAFTEALPPECFQQSSSCFTAEIESNSVEALRVDNSQPPIEFTVSLVVRTTESEGGQEAASIELPTAAELSPDPAVELIVRRAACIACDRRHHEFYCPACVCRFRDFAAKRSLARDLAPHRDQLLAEVTDAWTSVGGEDAADACTQLFALRQRLADLRARADWRRERLQRKHMRHADALRDTATSKKMAQRLSEKVPAWQAAVAERQQRLITLGEKLQRRLSRLTESRRVVVRDAFQYVFPLAPAPVHAAPNSLAQASAHQSSNALAQATVHQASNSLAQASPHQLSNAFSQAALASSSSPTAPDRLQPLTVHERSNALAECTFGSSIAIGEALSEASMMNFENGRWVVVDEAGQTVRHSLQRFMLDLNDVQIPDNFAFPVLLNTLFKVAESSPSRQRNRSDAYLAAMQRTAQLVDLLQRVLHVFSPFQVNLRSLILLQSVTQHEFETAFLKLRANILLLCARLAQNHAFSTHLDTPLANLFSLASAARKQATFAVSELPIQIAQTSEEEFSAALRRTKWSERANADIGGFGGNSNATGLDDWVDVGLWEPPPAAAADESTALDNSISGFVSNSVMSLFR